jgi:hypothetical protein
MKEKNESRKSSVTVKELMNYVDGQLKKYRFHPDDLDKIMNGLWVEKKSCIAREHLALNTEAQVVHHGIADAFYELFKLMKENDLALQDLECFPHGYGSSHPNPIIDFTIRTYEHEYKYYPVMPCNQCDSEEDEYLLIKIGVARLKTAYCDSSHRWEDDF